MKQQKNNELKYLEELYCFLTFKKCVENSECWKYKNTKGECSNQFKRVFRIPGQL